MRGLMAAAGVLVLAGCATPPGKLTSAELQWMEVRTTASVPKVYAGLRENSRQCGGLINEFEPKWYPAADMKSVKVDLFIKGMGGSASQWVAGLIELKSSEGGTNVRAGIQNPYSNPVFKSKDWWKPKVALMIKEIQDNLPASCK